MNCSHILMGVIQVGLSRQKSSDIHIHINGEKSKNISVDSMRLRVGVLHESNRTARISSHATISEHISSIHTIFHSVLIIEPHCYLA